MTSRSNSWGKFWLLVCQTISWMLLLPGFILIWKSAIDIATTRQVTTSSLSWASAGLLLLLIGSLINSLRQEFKSAERGTVDLKD